MDDKIYTALGLMSGTSLDGIDVAVIETDGVDIFGFGKTAERAFTEAERAILTDATQDALKWRFSGPPPNSFAQAEDVIDAAPIAAIGAFKADLIGYHGQTILHHPPIKGKHGQTLQLGRGQTLADALHIPVAYDFRTADVAAGGQGAPLAPIYHEALVRYSKLEDRVAVLNIGGVSNVSLIEGGKLKWATDCGPGNGPLDSWMSGQSAGHYDKDGAASLAGEVDHSLIAKWLQRDFFNRPVPRSADRYDFNVLGDISNVDLENGAATLASFCAQAIAKDLRNVTPDKVVVCGGGRKNPAIMAMLGIHIDADILLAEDVGWDGDMLEAQAFAYLAVRTLKGLPISFPETTGAPEPMTGGRISYPEDDVFGIAYGTANVELKDPDWDYAKAQLSNGIIDHDVQIAMFAMMAMINKGEPAPENVNFSELQSLYTPLYPDYVRGLVEEAQNRQKEQFGEASPEEIWKKLLKDV